jgi:hypothetical protein
MSNRLSLILLLVATFALTHADVSNIIDLGIYDSWGVEDIGKVYDKYIGTGLPVAVLFLDVIEKDQNEYAIAELTKAAETFKGKVLFMHGDGRQYKTYLSELGGDPTELPELIVTDTKKKVQFSYPYQDQNDVFDSKDITAWIQSIIDGDIAPNKKRDEL